MMILRSVSDLIIAALETHHLLSAPQLVQKLHEQGRTVNKTSVYRAIDKLLERDILCQHNLQADIIAYELMQDHHDHVVCKNCGKVRSTSCAVPVTPEVSGFKIDHHHVTFFGTCANCIAETGNPPESPLAETVTAQENP